MRRKEQWLAKRVEELIAELEADPAKVFDVVIVGSGYGGAVAASRFARARQKDCKPLSVCLLERGFEPLRSFPARLADYPVMCGLAGADEPDPQGRLEGAVGPVEQDDATNGTASYFSINHLRPLGPTTNLGVVGLTRRARQFQFTSRRVVSGPYKPFLLRGRWVSILTLLLTERPGSSGIAGVA